METKPYLIALDLDGTLLKDDKTISTRTLDVIQKVSCVKSDVNNMHENYFLYIS